MPHCDIPDQPEYHLIGVAELEERMSKLEGKVDSLTDLMTQILQHLKDK